MLYKCTSPPQHISWGGTPSICSIIDKFEHLVKVTCARIIPVKVPFIFEGSSYLWGDSLRISCCPTTFHPTVLRSIDGSCLDELHRWLQMVSFLFLSFLRSLSGIWRHLPFFLPPFGVLLKSGLEFFFYSLCKTRGQAWWFTLVIPALWEGKEGRSPELRNLRAAWPKWWKPISTKNTKISGAW